MENKTYVFEGKTTNEAIENGLKELKVSKNKVEIKVLEQEDKRSFFSILAPRVVKVEMKLKDNSGSKQLKENKKENVEKTVINGEEAEKIVKEFLEEFLSKMPGEKLEYKVEVKEEGVFVDIDGKDAGFLIGYRGEVMNSIQNVLTNDVNKSQVNENILSMAVEQLVKNDN